MRARRVATLGLVALAAFLGAIAVRDALTIMRFRREDAAAAAQLAEPPRAAPLPAAAAA
eukprot:COSAG04_NODE_2922_length_3381_cov_62.270871_1_plen_58_part_10